MRDSDRLVRMRSAPPIAACAVLVLFGCGDDTAADVVDDGTAGETTEAAESTSSSGAVVDSSSGFAPDTSSSSADEPPAELEYARGIRLTRIVANQGVQIELVTEGVEIDPAMHIADNVGAPSARRGRRPRSEQKAAR